MSLRLCIVAFVAMSLLGAFSGHAQPPVMRGYWAGTLGESAIIMRIAVEPAGERSSVGSYVYQRYGSSIGLTGNAVDGRYTFVEYFGAAGVETGTFRGAVPASGNELLTGEWSSPDGKRRLKYSLRRIALLDSLSVEQRFGSMRVSFTCYFPTFVDRPALQAAAVNGTIAGIVRYHEHALFARESERDGAPGLSDSISHEESAVLTLEPILVTDRLMTLTGMSEYYGGAHPSYGFENYSYAFEPGGWLRQLADGDIFKQGTAYRKSIAKLIFAELKRSAYPCVEDLRVERMEAYVQAESFAVAGDGLLFRLWPGAHVCGPADDIFIPYRRLRPYLDSRSVVLQATARR